MNPIKELRGVLTYTQIATKTSFSRQYVQMVADMTPERVSRVRYSTIIKLQEDLGVDLISYINNK